MGIPIPNGFAGVKASGFDALPKGTYGAQIVEASFQEASENTASKFETANPGEQHPGVIKWEFDITDPVEYNNRKVWHYTSLAGEKGLGMLKSVLLALGFTDEELNNPKFDLDLENDPRIKGANVELKCKPDRDDDTQTRVMAVLPVGEMASPLP